MNEQIRLLEAEIRTDLATIGDVFARLEAVTSGDIAEQEIVAGYCFICVSPTIADAVLRRGGRRNPGRGRLERVVVVESTEPLSSNSDGLTNLQVAREVPSTYL